MSLANTQMERKSSKHHSFAKCVARKAEEKTLEITLSPTIWKEFLFHVITVARLYPHDTVCPNTKVDSINKFHPLKRIISIEY